MNKKNKILYYILIVILILIIILIIFRAYIHFTSFKEHRQYFNNPNPKIEPWMTVGLVISRFNVSEDTLKKELNLKEIIMDKRLTLDQVCRKNKLDCMVVVDRLNNK